MTKTLVLFRHGRSQAKDYTEDKERTLTEKGFEEVEQTAQRLKDEVHFFDRIYCSTAVRAVETFKEIESHFDLPGMEVEYRENLYMPSKDSLLHFIRATPAHLNNILIVGHNPSLHEVVQEIAEREIECLETAAWISLRYDIAHWSELHFKYCISQQLVKPELVTE